MKTIYIVRAPFCVWSETSLALAKRHLRERLTKDGFYGFILSVSPDYLEHGNWIEHYGAAFRLEVYCHVDNSKIKNKRAIKSSIYELLLQCDATIGKDNRVAIYAPRFR